MKRYIAINSDLKVIINNPLTKREYVLEARALHVLIKLVVDLNDRKRKHLTN